MRTAKTVLTVIQERGKQKKPIERVYKLLFNRELYLNAYAKLYPNNGAMTKGVTNETVQRTGAVLYSRTKFVLVLEVVLVYGNFIIENSCV